MYLHYAIISSILLYRKIADIWLGVSKTPKRNAVISGGKLKNYSLKYGHTEHDLRCERFLRFRCCNKAIND